MLSHFRYYNFLQKLNHILLTNWLYTRCSLFQIMIKDKVSLKKSCIDLYGTSLTGMGMFVKIRQNVTETVTWDTLLVQIPRVWYHNKQKFRCTCICYYMQKLWKLWFWHTNLPLLKQTKMKLLYTSLHLRVFKSCNIFTKGEMNVFSSCH